MKLTGVTAVFNAIKSGNRENLIRCVRSVAALKTEHEHLIYDGGSTDGTVELLRELEKKIGQESRSTADGSSSPHVDLTQSHRDTEGHREVFEKGEARGLGCNPNDSVRKEKRFLKRCGKMMCSNLEKVL